MFSTGTPDQALTYVKDELNKHVEVTDLGPVKKILGVTVTRDLDAHTITLSQQIYIEEILQ